MDKELERQLLRYLTRENERHEREDHLDDSLLGNIAWDEIGAWAGWTYGPDVLAMVKKYLKR
jgi:hypothetical protein